MQPVNKTVRRGVFRDCLKAMLTPLVLLSASNLLARLLSVLILAVCILATVVLAPAVSMLGNFSMLRNALRHDNVIFGRFLRQDMQKALEGELQYQLEDAPNDLRTAVTDTARWYASRRKKTRRYSACRPARRCRAIRDNRKSAGALNGAPALKFNYPVLPDGPPHQSSRAYHSSPVRQKPRERNIFWLCVLNE